MQISAQTTVQQVFDQFANQFQYLRLEFYHQPHGNEEGSPAEDQISHKTTLGTINPSLQDQTFVVDGAMTVAAFESMMREKFNLNVQVFRKSAEVWLQTTATDHWSLDKQNNNGGGFESVDDIEAVDITDFDVE
jgi:hypothetical protein